MLASGLVTSQKPQPYEGGELRELIDQLKAKTDLREYLRPRLSHHAEFDGYWQAKCLSPEHDDTQASMLVYPDQCRCTACSFKADILDFYRMEHPDTRLVDAITELMTNPDIKFAGEVKARELRGLDQDLGTRYHLALVEHPEAVTGLEGMGFTREAIRFYQLGYAEVLVRLWEKEYPLAATAPRIEWLEINGEQVPFQLQWRYSVPVIRDGRLVQVLYRRAVDGDLGPKITMEKGAGVHLFNADALRDAEMAVYCEGWGDAIVYWQAGIVAVTSTSGAGHFNEEWSDLLGHVKRLYVVGDADNAGQRMMARFKQRLPWARPLELPWSQGTKMDNRDLWLAGWRRNDFLRMLKQADLKSSWSAMKRTRA